MLYIERPRTRETFLMVVVMLGVFIHLEFDRRTMHSGNARKTIELQKKRGANE